MQFWSIVDKQDRWLVGCIHCDNKSAFHLYQQYAVAHLVQTLSYKPEVRGSSGVRFPVESLRIFRPHYDPGIDWISNRNKHQEWLQQQYAEECLRRSFCATLKQRSQFNFSQIACTKTQYGFPKFTLCGQHNSKCQQNSGSCFSKVANEPNYSNYGLMMTWVQGRN